MEVPSRLQLVELCGLVLTEAGVALGYLGFDELVLPGDEVVLFAVRYSSVFRALPNAGLYFVERGAVVPERSNVFAADVRGKSFFTKAEFISQIRTVMGVR